MARGGDPKGLLEIVAIIAIRYDNTDAAEEKYWIRRLRFSRRISMRPASECCSAMTNTRFTHPLGPVAAFRSPSVRVILANGDPQPIVTPLRGLQGGKLCEGDAAN